MHYDQKDVWSCLKVWLAFQEVEGDYNVEDVQSH